jgi:predicted nucleic acid-binding protein
MILLDTNVISEAMRPAPRERVMEWMASQPSSQLFTTAISEAEILSGLAMLPAGKRRAALEEVARRMFAQHFMDRILPFDRGAAQTFAVIMAARRKQGRPIGPFDAQIAAIARAHGAALATRDVADFNDCGIEVIDPWSA